MAIGSGAGAYFGISAESTWGTYVAPTRFLPGNFTVKAEHQTVPVGGYAAAGRLGPVDEIETLLWGTGHYEGEVLRTGMGLLLQHVTGGSAVPVQQAATTAYLQTHVVGDNYGKGLSAQAVVPNTAGTLYPFTLYGSKVASATFSCAKGESLKVAVDLWGKKMDQVQTAAASGYTATQAALPFNWTQMNLKLGTFNSEAATSGVKGVSVTIGRSMNADDSFYAGGQGYPSEPVMSAGDLASLIPITGTVDIDLMTKAEFVDRFMGHTNTSLLWDFIHSTAIASTYYPTWSLQTPKVYFDTTGIDVSGANVINASVPFKAFVDTTNGYATMKYMSTDTAI
ncbi:MAG TPA: phage tail tube protein [Microthrixaceae bacterium]|nr:phage tail tube protein [Microthrixaceae bacterium]HNH94292.1 phage tail tube protein [Microthrixaceae bacterium]